MIYALAISRLSLYQFPPSPAQPACPRLGLPNKFHRDQSRQVDALRFSARFVSGGTPTGAAGWIFVLGSCPPAQPAADRQGVRQARDAGVANATSRTERSRQRSIPGPRLGLPKRFHRERSRSVEARRFSTRIGSGGTPGQARDAGVAGRNIEPCFCPPAQPGAGRQGDRQARTGGVVVTTSRSERRRQRSIPVVGEAVSTAFMKHTGLLA